MEVGLGVANTARPPANSSSKKKQASHFQAIKLSLLPLTDSKLAHPSTKQYYHIIVSTLASCHMISH